MTIDEKLKFKRELFELSKEMLEKRIMVSQAAIDNAQSSANEEEKSSAGDKYETSRAMSHIEKDMHAKQLSANKYELSELLSIDPLKIFSSISPGAVIKGNTCSFFIASGLGKIIVNEQVVYLLSPNAPLANLLYTKKQGDSFHFNKSDIIITEVF